MKPIQFSEAFMKKFGNVVHQEKEKHWLTTRILYMIDWRTRATENLKVWLDNQIKDHKKKKGAVWKKAQEYKHMPNDKKATAILRFVNGRSRYRSDQQGFRTPEYWQTAQEMWDSKVGDCEDGAVLIYILCRLAGVPDTQLRIIAGMVYDPFTKKDAGHCWVYYRADHNGMEYYLDWCYYYDGLGITRGRAMAWSLKKYKIVWWSVNSTRAYGRFRNKVR